MAAFLLAVAKLAHAADARVADLTTAVAE